MQKSSDISSISKGCGNTMPDLSDPVSFDSWQVINFFLYWDKFKKVLYVILNNLKCELTFCVENSVDPDQLTSSEAS